MKLFLRCHFITAFFLIFTFSGCGGGGGSSPSTAVQTGTINGYVYVPVSGAARMASAPSGCQALEGASVTVNGTTLFATTNSSGYYAIAGVPAGNAIVTYSKSGYRPVQFTVNVIANQNTTVTERDSSQGVMVSQILSVIYPESGILISDVDFRAETFYVEITHSAPIASNSLSVSFSMDGGTLQSITSYFSEINTTTFRSNNLYQFTRTLFDLPSNGQRRTMTINISARDALGNTTSTTHSFVVYPVSPPGQ